MDRITSFGGPAASLLVFITAAAVAETTPIQCIVDVHCDPMAMAPAVQLGQYQAWTEWVNWGLTAAEDVGGKISFLSTGEYMDWVLDDPGVVEAYDLIPRLVASGDDFLGTHSHNRLFESMHVWVQVPNGAPDDVIAAHWEDHLMRINMVIQEQLGVTDISEIQAINCGRGAHLPSEDDEELFHELAVEYNFPIRQQGPAEGFYGYFDHFVWHSFRPSTDNLLVHDPDGAMIISPFGPVLGRVGFHHGVLQDMSSPAVKGRFLKELLSWLDEAQFGDVDHVWTTGWSAHCHDLLPGGESHDSWQDMFQWMAMHFVEEQVAGMQAVEFSSIKTSAALYSDWEDAHPDEIPFTYAQSEADLDAYPWLKAPLAYLTALHWDAAMPSEGVLRWHRLAEPDGPRVAYVLWTTSGEEIVIDLSAHLETGVNWVAVEPHRGHYRFVDATEVPVRFAGTILIPSGLLETFQWLPDLDEDGSVAVDDLLEIISTWGACPDLPATCHGDLDGDGDVDIDDLLLVLSSWAL
jgi:hypothetical protein